MSGGAARGDCGEPRPAPPTQHAVNLVAMDQRATPPAPRGKSVGQHAQHRRIGLAREVAIRPGAPDEREQLRLVPVLRVDLRRDLLGDHVERRHRHDQPVEFAAIDAVDQRCAFDEVVIGEGKQAAFRLTADAVPRAADALQEGRDRARRAELADEVHIADIDAELERGCRDHSRERAGFQPLLSIEPLFLGEAAMMRCNVHLAEPVRKLARDAFGHASCVDKDERGAVFLNELRQSVIDLAPDLGRHHCFERGGWHVELKVARAEMPAVDDQRPRTVRARADQELCHLLDRLLRGREPDPLQLAAAKGG